MLGCQPGKLRIEVGRETLPSAGEIYLLDFFRLTPRPMGRGSFVRSFVREVLMISPRANCSCMRKTGEIDGLSFRANDFSIFF